MSEILDHPLASGIAPSWAWGWGQDAHGVFVEIKIGEVEQRMRWIPEGTFIMGSPEEEEGRATWEGPQHQVTLTQGFWLADTPCTQALWQEVMGENPSRFVSPTRPVEQVSWDACQRFLERTSERRPDLRLQLPTEAQWEYACRADTETATWRGAVEILGERNAPALDPIAWYGGNSGDGFELDEGFDSSAWKEKQVEHNRAGTRPVKGKLPNPWGLYDMLGNVWEWCRDHWEFGTGYAEAARTDPVGEEGSRRVVRGGSWSGRARDVRAAYRGGGHPGARYDFVGFRLSRGPEPAPGR